MRREGRGRRVSRQGRVLEASIRFFTRAVHVQCAHYDDKNTRCRVRRSPFQQQYSSCVGSGMLPAWQSRDPWAEEPDGQSCQPASRPHPSQKQLDMPSLARKSASTTQ